MPSFRFTLVAAAIALVAAERWTSYLAAAALVILPTAALWPVAMLLDVAPPLAAAVHLGLLGLIVLSVYNARPDQERDQQISAVLPTIRQPLQHH